MRRWIGGLLVAGFALGAVGRPVRAQDHAAPLPTTIVLVRHAEKAAEPANDPPLTAEGETRARALWDVVRHAGVGAIITTQFARTKQTAEPTASALGIEPQVAEARGRAPEHARALVAKLRAEHSGKTVLVVGHSNTIPEIIAALGAPRPRDICDGEYDDFFVVQIQPDGKALLTRAKYGEHTPEGSGCSAPAAR
jgi:broad specificity phosphatase PhoE